MAPEQGDAVMRALGSLIIGQISLSDKELRFLPASWLALVAAQIPATLPVIDKGSQYGRLSRIQYI